MQFLTAGIGELLTQLDGDFPNAGGIRLLSVSLPGVAPERQLEWLAAQTQWPQFYWQQRDGHQFMAALGSVCTFDSLRAAQDFIRTAGAELPELTLCGLNAFDPARGALFLPRLLWRQDNGQASLSLTLSSARSLACDARVARTFIASLAAQRPLKLRRQTLRRHQHTPDKAQWQRLVGQALTAIESGGFEKVVLARVSDLFFPGPVSAPAFLAASQQVNLRCFHFYMGFSPREAFIGSSPERLWRRCDRALRTEAVAGTVANDPDGERAAALGQWLMQDDKNQRENGLVVEDIRQRLDGAVDNMHILPPQVIRLRKVQHLRRCIWATLNKPDDWQCLMLLQPTAAVAGVPRQSARAFLDQHEPFERDWYAGSAGYLCAARAEFCVALRSAHVNCKRVRLYAGAGIVAGSDPLLEWQEIENKAAGLRTLLCAEAD